MNKITSMRYFALSLLFASTPLMQLNAAGQSWWQSWWSSPSVEVKAEVPVVPATVVKVQPAKIEVQADAHLNLLQRAQLLKHDALVWGKGHPLLAAALLAGGVTGGVALYQNSKEVKAHWRSVRRNMNNSPVATTVALFAATALAVAAYKNNLLPKLS